MLFIRTQRSGVHFGGTPKVAGRRAGDNVTAAIRSQGRSREHCFRGGIA